MIVSELTGMEEVSSSALLTPERGLVEGVLDLEEAAERGLVGRRCGEEVGVARLSWTHTSSGSWKGSVSSLPMETMLSATSREEEEGSWDWALWCVCVSVCVCVLGYYIIHPYRSIEETLLGLYFAAYIHVYTSTIAI